jgi:hypothetical protein
MEIGRGDAMSGFTDYPVVTPKSNRCKMIAQSSEFRSDCTDYSTVTRKSICCKVIGQSASPGTGCGDYSIVTLKSRCCKDIMIPGAFRLFRRHTQSDLQQ